MSSLFPFKIEIPRVIKSMQFARNSTRTLFLLNMHVILLFDINFSVTLPCKQSISLHCEYKLIHKLLFFGDDRFESVSEICQSCPIFSYIFINALILLTVILQNTSVQIQIFCNEKSPLKHTSYFLQPYVSRIKLFQIKIKYRKTTFILMSVG